MLSCVSCESRLYTVVDLVLLTKDEIAKEKADKIRPPRTSLTLRTLVSFSTPAQSPHSSVDISNYVLKTSLKRLLMYSVVRRKFTRG